MRRNAICLAFVTLILSHRPPLLGQAAQGPLSYFAIAPCRVLDTRTPASTPLRSQVAKSVQLTGTCGIPSTASAVSFNLMVTQPSAAGVIQIFPGDQTGTSTSTINFGPGQSRSNNAVVALATSGPATGTLLLRPFLVDGGSVHAVVDVNGYFSADQAPVPGAVGPMGFQPIDGCRILDTRTEGSAGLPLGIGETRPIQIGGTCQIPHGAPALALNVTTTQASGKGTLGLGPATAAPSSVPIVAFDPTQLAMANGTITALGATGTADLALSASGAAVEVILDSAGYFDLLAPLQFYPITGCRALDTRTSGGGPLTGAGSIRLVDLQTPCGVPAGAAAAVVNLTVISPSAAGHLVAFPAGASLPGTSFLNFNAGEPALANGGIVGLANVNGGPTSLSLVAGGLPASEHTDVIVDVFGYYFAGGGPKDLPQIPDPLANANLETGFKPDNGFLGSNLDSVNPLNGNLSVSIPLGRHYPVGGSLTYGLRLTYNSKIYAFDSHSAASSNGIAYAPEGFPSPLWNAGAGWLLTLGELRAPTLLPNGGPPPVRPFNGDSDHPGQWVYIAPDGSSHAFYRVLNVWNGANLAAPSDNPLYTRDGTYLRLTIGPPAADGTVQVEFPEGRIETYVHADGVRWVLRSIRDRFNSAVTFTYSPETDRGHPQSVTLQESVGGSAGRSQKIFYYSSDPNAPGGKVNWLGRPLVQRVELTAFAGTDHAPAAPVVAVYTFNYSPQYLPPPCGTEYFPPPIWSGPQSSQLQLWRLDSLGLPDGSSYRFTYAADNSGSLPDNSCARSMGMMTRMQLPAGGAVNWGYQSWNLPVAGCDDRTIHSQSAGVSTRSLVDLGGHVTAGPWIYGQQLLFKPATNQTRCGTRALRVPEQEEQTTVTDPAGNQTVYFFSVWPPGDDQSIYSAGVFADRFESGVQLTRRVSDATSKLFLSQQTCSGACQWSTGGTIQNPLRSSYVGWERDSDLDPSQYAANVSNNPGSAHFTDVQRRLAARHTVFEDDSTSIDDSHSDFDGLGHYRTELLSQTFFPGGGAPKDIGRTIYTQYNPQAGTYTPGAGSFTAPPPASPWILDTYGQVKVQEQQTDGGNASSHVDYTCFDPATGFLRAQRTLRNSASGAMSATDLLVVLTPDASGNVVATSYYGADDGGLDTNPADGCTGNLPPPGYSINFSYANGALASAQHVGAPFKDLDRSVDWSTGLPITDRSAAGIFTGYAFDSLNRLTRIMPGDTGGTAVGCPSQTSDAWTAFVYNAAGSTPAACADTNPENGACVQQLVYRSGCQSSTQQLSEHRFVFDGLGRLHREFRTMPGSTAQAPVWGGRLKTYNVAGLPDSTYEWTAPSATVPTNYTRATNYDAFGRPGLTTLPDGSKRLYFYGGIDTTTEWTYVATGVDASGSLHEDKAEAIDKYDRFGRLVLAQEPPPLPPAAGTTAVPNSVARYLYDVADHLTGVTVSTGQPGGYGQQVRQFGYDDLGFLRFASMPEKSSNVVYGAYDARGHYRQRTDGGRTVFYTYDTAERPICLSGADHDIGCTAAPLKVFQYDTAGYGNSLGQLVRSSRFNHLALPSMPTVEVVERLTYSGRGGRPSHREVSESARQQTFEQDFSYDDFGHADQVHYPWCNFSPCLGTDPGRSIGRSFDQGLLTAVNGYATLSYHPNLLVDTIQFSGSRDFWQQANDPHEMPRPGSIQAWGTPIETFAYDSSGNVTRFGPETYLYDLTGRLTSGTLGDGSQQIYDYDPFGNLTGISTGNAAGGTATILPLFPDPATNHLGGASSYDAAGNLTTWSLAAAYTYDELNLMTQFSSGQQNWYHLYDANDQRVWSFSPQTAQHPDLSRWTLRDLSGKVLRRYETVTSATATNTWSFAEDYIYRGSTLLAGETPQGTHHFIDDHLGTPRLTSDANGNPIAAHFYFPFGQEAYSSSDLEPARFAGYERDLHDPSGPQDDLDYVGTRFLSPITGRFLSTDAGGCDTARPQSWNRYAYALNNPLRFIDRDGHDPVDVVPGTGLDISTQTRTVDGLTIETTIFRYRTGNVEVQETAEVEREVHVLPAPPGSRGYPGNVAADEVTVTAGSSYLGFVEANPAGDPLALAFETGAGMALDTGELGAAAFGLATGREATGTVKTLFVTYKGVREMKWLTPAGKWMVRFVSKAEAEQAAQLQWYFNLITHGGEAAATASSEKLLEEIFENANAEKK